MVRVQTAGRRHPALLGVLVGLYGCDPAPPVDDPLPWPSAEGCADLEQWPAASLDLERQVLQRIDDTRILGGDCGERGKPGPAPALVRVPSLDCAARFHARDMVEREYFGRLDPDGVDEHARVEATGYLADVVVQHIAQGPRDAAELVERTWLPRPVPCSNLLSEQLLEVGLAHRQAPAGDDPQTEPATEHWVIVLAAPHDPNAGDPTTTGE